MGTRADFYVGRGPEAEWLGSIAWDGDDGSNADEPWMLAITEEAYRADVARFLALRDDATTPEQGWPWPWETSHTTDYAYAFVASETLQSAGKVLASCFGCPWYDPAEHWAWTNEQWEVWDNDHSKMPKDAFPDMTARKNVAHDRRSGLLYVTRRQP